MTKSTYPVVVDGVTYNIPVPAGMKPSPQYVSKIAENIRRARRQSESKARTEASAAAEKAGVWTQNTPETDVEKTLFGTWNQPQPQPNPLEGIFGKNPLDEYQRQQAQKNRQEFAKAIRMDTNVEPVEDIVGATKSVNEFNRLKRIEKFTEQLSNMGIKKGKWTSGRGIDDESYILNLADKYNSKKPGYQQNRENILNIVRNTLKSSGMPTTKAVDFVNGFEEDRSLTPNYAYFTNRMKRASKYVQRAMELAEASAKKAALIQRLVASDILPKDAIKRAAYHLAEAKRFHRAAMNSEELAQDLELKRDISSWTPGMVVNTIGDVFARPAQTINALMQGMTPEEADYYIKEGNLYRKHAENLLGKDAAKTWGDVLETGLKVADMGVGVALSGGALSALRGLTATKAAGTAAGSLLGARGATTGSRGLAQMIGEHGLLGYGGMIPRAAETTVSAYQKAKAQGEDAIQASMANVASSLNPFMILHDPQASVADKVVGVGMGSMMLLGGLQAATRLPHKALAEKLSRHIPEIKDVKLSRGVLESLDHALSNADKMAASYGVDANQFRQMFSAVISTDIKHGADGLSRLEKLAQTKPAEANNKKREEYNPVKTLADLSARVVTAVRPSTAKKIIPDSPVAVRMSETRNVDTRTAQQPTEPIVNIEANPLGIGAAKHIISEIQRSREEASLVEEQANQARAEGRTAEALALGAKARELRMRELAAKDSLSKLDPRLVVAAATEAGADVNDILPRPKTIERPATEAQPEAVQPTPDAQIAVRPEATPQGEMPEGIPQDALASTEPFGLDAGRGFPEDAAPIDRTQTPPEPQTVGEPPQARPRPVVLQEAYSVANPINKANPGETYKAARWYEAREAPDDWYVVVRKDASADSYGLGTGNYHVASKTVPDDVRPEDAVWYVRSRDKASVLTVDELAKTISEAVASVKGKRQMSGPEQLRSLVDAVRSKTPDATPEEIGRVVAEHIANLVGTEQDLFQHDKFRDWVRERHKGKEMLYSPDGQKAAFFFRPGSNKGASAVYGTEGMLAKRPEGALTKEDKDYIKKQAEAKAKEQDKLSKLDEKIANAKGDAERAKFQKERDKLLKKSEEESDVDEDADTTDSDGEDPWDSEQDVKGKVYSGSRIEEPGGKVKSASEVKLKQFSDGEVPEVVRPNAIHEDRRYTFDGETWVANPKVGKFVPQTTEFKGKSYEEPIPYLDWEAANPKTINPEYMTHYRRLGYTDSQIKARASAEHALAIGAALHTADINNAAVGQIELSRVAKVVKKHGFVLQNVLTEDGEETVKVHIYGELPESAGRTRGWNADSLGSIPGVWTTDLGEGFIPMAWAKITAGSANPAMAATKLWKMDLLRELYGLPKSVAEYSRIMGHANGTRFPLIGPEILFRRLENKNKGLVQLLRELGEHEVEEADKGFSVVEQIKDLYARGEGTPEDTARILVWTFYSRRLSPYPHEAMAILADANGMDHWVQRAASGEWNGEDTVEYLRWAINTIRNARKRGEGKSHPAGGGTMNLRALGTSLLQWLSVRDANGKTNAQALTELLREGRSAREIRRAFFILPRVDQIDGHKLTMTPAEKEALAKVSYDAAMEEWVMNGKKKDEKPTMKEHKEAVDALVPTAAAPGFKNKILSFALLMIGRDDQVILDRIQINDMFAPLDEDGNRIRGADSPYNGITSYPVYKKTPEGGYGTTPIGYIDLSKISDKDVEARFGEQKGKALEEKRFLLAKEKFLKETGVPEEDITYPPLTTATVVNRFDEIDGLLQYEMLEDLIGEVAEGAFKEAGLDPDKASVGRYHWYVWNHNGGQEAGHQSIAEILRFMQSSDERFAGVTAREGQYDTIKYGMLWTHDIDGEPVALALVPGEPGQKPRFIMGTVGEIEKYYAELQKIMQKHDKEFQISTHKDPVPWFYSKVGDEYRFGPEFFADVNKLADRMVKDGKTGIQEFSSERFTSADGRDYTPSYVRLALGLGDVGVDGIEPGASQRPFETGGLEGVSLPTAQAHLIVRHLEASRWLGKEVLTDEQKRVAYSEAVNPDNRRIMLPDRSGSAVVDSGGHVLWVADSSDGPGLDPRLIHALVHPDLGNAKTIFATDPEAISQLESSGFRKVGLVHDNGRLVGDEKTVLSVPIPKDAGNLDAFVPDAIQRLKDVGMDVVGYTVAGKGGTHLVIEVGRPTSNAHIAEVRKVFGVRDVKGFVHDKGFVLSPSKTNRKIFSTFDPEGVYRMDGTAFGEPRHEVGVDATHVNVKLRDGDSVSSLVDQLGGAGKLVDWVVKDRNGEKTLVVTFEGRAKEEAIQSIGQGKADKREVSYLHPDKAFRVVDGVRREGVDDSFVYFDGRTKAESPQTYLLAFDPENAVGDDVVASNIGAKMADAPPKDAVFYVGEVNENGRVVPDGGPVTIFKSLDDARRAAERREANGKPSEIHVVDSKALDQSKIVESDERVIAYNDIVQTGVKGQTKVPLIDKNNIEEYRNAIAGEIHANEASDPDKARTNRIDFEPGGDSRFMAGPPKGIPPSQRFGTPPDKAPLNADAFLPSVRGVADFVGPAFKSWALSDEASKRTVAEYISAFHNEFGREPETLIECHLIANASIQSWPPYQMTKIASLLESLPEAVRDVVETITDKDQLLPIAYLDTPVKSGALAYCLENGPVVLHPVSLESNIDARLTVAHEMWHFIFDRALGGEVTWKDWKDLNPSDGYNLLMGKIGPEFQNAVKSANDILIAGGRSWLKNALSDPAAMGHDFAVATLDMARRMKAEGKSEKEISNAVFSAAQKFAMDANVGPHYMVTAMISAAGVLDAEGHMLPTLYSVFEAPAYLMTFSEERANAFFSGVATEAEKNGVIRGLQDTFFENTAFGKLMLGAKEAKERIWRVDPDKGTADPMVKEAIGRVFKGSSVEFKDNGDIEIVLPNKKRITVTVTKEPIEPDVNILLKDYGIPNSDGVVIPASWRLVSDDGTILSARGLITLAKGAGMEELLHESLHAAKAFGLITAKEWSSLLKAYGDEEGIARAYESWNPADGKVSIFKKLWRRAVALLHGLGSYRDEVLYQNNSAFFNKLRSGEAWKRNSRLRESVSAEHYAARKKPPTFDENNPNHAAAKSWFDTGRFASGLFDDDNVGDTIRKMWNAEKDAFADFFRQQTGKDLPEDELFATYLAGRMGWVKDLSKFAYGKIKDYESNFGDDDAGFGRIVTLKLLDLYAEASKGNIPDNLYDPVVAKEALLSALTARSADWEKFGLYLPGYLHEGENTTFAATDEIRDFWPGMMSDRDTGQDLGAPVKHDETLVKQAQALLYAHGTDASVMMDHSVKGQIEIIAERVLEAGTGRNAEMKDFDPTKPTRPMTDAETVAAGMAIERLRYLKYQREAQIVHTENLIEQLKRDYKARKIKKAEFERQKSDLMKVIANLTTESADLDSRANVLVQATRYSGTELGRALRARRVETKHTPWYDHQLLVDLTKRKFKGVGKTITVNAETEIRGHAARVNVARTKASVKNTRNATKHPQVKAALQKFNVFDEFQKALNHIELNVSRLEKELEKVYADARGRAFTKDQLEAINRINRELEQATHWHDELARQMLLGSDWGDSWKSVFLGKYREEPGQKQSGNVVERTIENEDGTTKVEGHRRAPSPAPKPEKEFDPVWGVQEQIVETIRDRIMQKKAEMEGTKELSDLLLKLSQILRTPEDRKAEAQRRMDAKADKPDDEARLHIRVVREMVNRAKTREALLLRLEALKLQLDPESRHQLLDQDPEAIRAKREEAASKKEVHAHVMEEIRLTRSALRMLEEMRVMADEMETGEFTPSNQEVSVRVQEATRRVSQELGYDLLESAYKRQKKVYELQRRVSELEEALKSEDRINLANALGYKAAKAVAIGETEADRAEVRLWQDKAKDLERQGEILLDFLVPTDGLSAVRVVDRALIFTSFPARILDLVANQLKQAVDNNILSRAVDHVVEKLMFPDVIEARKGSTLLKPIADGGIFGQIQTVVKADVDGVLRSLREMAEYFHEMFWNRGVRGRINKYVELPSGEYGGMDKFGVGGQPLNLTERSNSDFVRPWLTRAEGLVNTFTATAGIGDVVASAMGYSRARMSLVESLVNHAIKNGQLKTEAEIAEARQRLMDPETVEGYQVHMIAMGDALEQVYLGRDGQFETMLMGVVNAPDTTHKSGKDAGRVVVTPTARKLAKIGMDVFVTEFPRIFMRIVGYNTDFAVGLAKLIPAFFAEAQKKAQAGDNAVKGVDYWDEIATKRAAGLIRRQAIGVGMIALANLYSDLEDKGKVPPLATYNKETKRFTFVNIAVPLLKRLGVDPKTAEVWVPLPIDQLGGPFSLFSMAYAQIKASKDKTIKDSAAATQRAQSLIQYFTSNPLLTGMERWAAIAMGYGVSEDMGYVRAKIGRALGTTFIPGIVRSFEYAHDRATGVGQRYASTVTEGFISQTPWGRNLPISTAGKIFRHLPKDAQREFVRVGYQPGEPPKPDSREQAINWISDELGVDISSNESGYTISAATLTPEEQERWVEMYTNFGDAYITNIIRSDHYRRAPDKLPMNVKDKSGAPVLTKESLLKGAVRDARTTAMAASVYGLDKDAYVALAGANISIRPPTQGESDDPRAFAFATKAVGQAVNDVLKRVPERVLDAKAIAKNALKSFDLQMDRAKASYKNNPAMVQKIERFKAHAKESVAKGGLVDSLVSKALSDKLVKLTNELTKELSDPRINLSAELKSTKEGREVIAKLKKRIADDILSVLIEKDYTKEIIPKIREYTTAKWKTENSKATTN